jgi:hypothetical protein
MALQTLEMAPVPRTVYLCMMKRRQKSPRRAETESAMFNAEMSTVSRSSKTNEEVDK